MLLMELFTSPQGEGSLVGQETTFVRFGGCNYACSWCDEPDSIPLDTPTRPRNKSEKKTPEEIANLVDFQKIRHVCITGGEPLIQPAHELKELCFRLTRSGHFISIESNGSRIVEEILPYVKMWTFSPKLTSSDNDSINPNVIIANLQRYQQHDQRIGKMQLKFVIGQLQDVFDMKKYLDAFPTIPVYIQSVWNEKTWSPIYTVDELKELLVRSDIDFKNKTIRFGVQLHKYMGVK